MNTNTELDLIGKQLDELHAQWRRAFLNRDIDAYRAFFTQDLRYTQPDGRTIGLQQLMRNVGQQFAQFKSVDDEFTREGIERHQDGTVSQIGVLSATYSFSIFFFFTKSWKIFRRGKYTYRKTDDGWRICDSLPDR